MAQVIWSPKASDHLNAIADYISRDSVLQANAVVLRVVKATRRLSTFPELGAVVPEFKDASIREIRVYSYRVLYLLLENKTRIRIVGVVHGAQMLTEDLLE